MRTFKTLALALLAAALLAAALASPASAAFGVGDFKVTFEDKDGNLETQAGAHPFVAANALAYNTVFSEKQGFDVPDGAVKDQRVMLPEGLAGNPTATPRCSGADFIDIIADKGLPKCDDSAAIGTVTVELEEPGEFQSFAVYNLVPPPGTAAKIGFIAITVPVTIEFKVSQSPPYRIIASAAYAPQALAVYKVSLNVWGNPADPAHDPYRGKCLVQVTPSPPDLVSSGDCPANTADEKPFITLPRACTGVLITDYEATSWQGGFDAGFAQTAAMGGCSKLSLTPERFTARPTTTSGGSASGLEVDLGIEDEGLTSPSSIANQSDIRKTVVTLPEGMTLNPSAAAGLEACSLAAYESESLDPGQGCPDAAKIGSVEVQTPLLENTTLRGSLYVAQQDDPNAPGQENPFDSMIAVYLVLKDPELGIVVRQAGRGELDPQSGQVTTIFDDLPQVPFSDLRLHLREGPRGPLVTPSACATHTVKAEFTPWAGGAPTTVTDSFQTGPGPGGCPSGALPFDPGFNLGSLSNTAGAHSTLFTRITRQDGEQDITRLGATLPPGLVAKIAGVPKCDGSALATAKAKTGRQELANPSCPAATQIGSTLAGAGVGASLTYVPGKAYLGGAFAGNPLSVIAITPGVAGPFDAGTVAIQVGLTIDPNTYRARIDAGSATPIPTILKGIPLRARDIRVNVDRPNFGLNPTSCDPFATAASLFGSEGATSSPRALYQAADCARLPFKPKLTLRLAGGTKRGDHPAFRAVLLPRPGDANIGHAITTLPPSEFIDNAHIQNPCTRVQFNANQCPKGSILGTATAFSPLLDEPLKGNIYFRSNGGERLLPDIVLDLHGLFDIVSVGYVDSKNARLRNTFASVPDAPIDKVIINLFGGKRGLLVNNRNLCAKPLKAKLAFTGQNNKPADSSVRVNVPGCGGKAGAAKR